MKIYNLKEKIEYLDEVANLEYDEWADEPDKKRLQRIENKKKKIINNFEKVDFCKLILLDKNELIGFISIFPHDSEEFLELTPWYATMYVKEKYRGKHYSKILNDAILKEAKQRGFKLLYLKTDLINYYEKFGAVYLEDINEKEKLYKFML